MTTSLASPLYESLRTVYPDRIRCDKHGACRLRIDDSIFDAQHSACSIELALTSAQASEFQLELINVPWNFALADLVIEVGGTLTGDDSRKVLRLSGTARNYRQIKHLSKAIRAVTGRGQHYLNSVLPGI